MANNLKKEINKIVVAYKSPKSLSDIYYRYSSPIIQLIESEFNSLSKANNHNYALSQIYNNLPLEVLMRITCNMDSIVDELYYVCMINEEDDEDKILSFEEYELDSYEDLYHTCDMLSDAIDRSDSIPFDKYIAAINDLINCRNSIEKYRERYDDYM